MQDSSGDALPREFFLCQEKSLLPNPFFAERMPYFDASDKQDTDRGYSKVLPLYISYSISWVDPLARFFSSQFPDKNKADWCPGLNQRR